MTDSFLILTPFLLFAVIALFTFVGCDRVLGLQHFPDPVSGLQAVAGNSEVTLTWDAFPSATDYHVLRTSGTTTTDLDTMSSATTYTDTTTYSYSVYAKTTGEDSGNSSTVMATPTAAISFVQMQATSQPTNPPIS